MSDISPTVTVIIPTYNRGYIIRRALHSVLNQTYRNLEVIVVDDGSTDDSELIVRSFGDARVRYIRHEMKQGAPAARNTGIKAAQTEFIAFQDSDDEWLCEKLEKQMAIFQRAGNEVGVVYTGFLRIEGNRVAYFPPKNIKKSGNILESLLNGNFVTTQGVVVRRECLITAGLFDEQLPRLQDWDLFLRLAKHYEFICIDEPLLVTFHSTVSITGNNNLLPIAWKIIIEKHRDLFMARRKALARNYYSFGKLICASNDVIGGRQYFVKSLQSNPLRLICWTRYLLTLPGRKFYRFFSEILDNIVNFIREKL